MDLKQNIHIGSAIKKVLIEKSVSIEEFSHKINKDRTTVYNIFERKTIDTDLLFKISNALDYDFIHNIYYQDNNNTQPSKIIVVIEVEENELEKLNLPEKNIRLVIPVN